MYIILHFKTNQYSAHRDAYINISNSISISISIWACISGVEDFQIFLIDQIWVGRIYKTQQTQEMRFLERENSFEQLN